MPSRNIKVLVQTSRQMPQCEPNQSRRASENKLQIKKPRGEPLRETRATQSKENEKVIPRQSQKQTGDKRSVFFCFSLREKDMDHAIRIPEMGVSKVSVSA